MLSHSDSIRLLIASSDSDIWTSTASSVPEGLPQCQACGAESPAGPEPLNTSQCASDSLRGHGDSDRLCRDDGLY